MFQFCLVHGALQGCSFRTVVCMGTRGKGHGGNTFPAALRSIWVLDAEHLYCSMCLILTVRWVLVTLINDAVVHMEQVGSLERDPKGNIARVCYGPHCCVLRSQARLNPLLSHGCGDFSKFSSLQNVSLSSQCSTPFTGGVLQAEKKMPTHCEGKII